MRRTLAVIAAFGLTACGPAESWQGQGVVRGLLSEENQIEIEHEDIPGLMPGMTMSFDVSDPALLYGIQVGMDVEFQIRKRGRAFEIFEVNAKGARPAQAGSAGRSGSFSQLSAKEDPAPLFELIDHEGGPIALTDLRGKVVLLDFIFTECPGPCPVLTGIHIDVQKRLDATQREGVRFVSITLDPRRDTPEVLKEYGERRGMDLRSWTLATGEVDTVERVVKSYGVGSVRQADGDIQHTVATFLIDPKGQIAKRYLGLTHQPDAILGDIAGLL